MCGPAIQTDQTPRHPRPPQAATGLLPTRSSHLLQGKRGYTMDACWLVVIISNLPFSPTWSRGEYLSVVRILEMVK